MKELFEQAFSETYSPLSFTKGGLRISNEGILDGVKKVFGGEKEFPFLKGKYTIDKLEFAIREINKSTVASISDVSIPEIQTIVTLKPASTFKVPFKELPSYMESLTELPIALAKNNPIHAIDSELKKVIVDTGTDAVLSPLLMKVVTDISKKDKKNWQYDEKTKTHVYITPLHKNESLLGGYVMTIVISDIDVSFDLSELPIPPMRNAGKDSKQQISRTELLSALRTAVKLWKESGRDGDVAEYYLYGAGNLRFDDLDELMRKTNYLDGQEDLYLGISQLIYSLEESLPIFHSTLEMLSAELINELLVIANLWLAKESTN